MQQSSDLKKIVTGATSKNAITDLIKRVSNSAIPDAPKRAALGALSDAFIAIAKGDEDAAAEHVRKCRATIQRAGLSG
jgi:hypothetical protein